MEANIYFSIALDYDRTSYEPLRVLGEVRYDSTDKKYHWTFPLSKLKDAGAIIGKPITFINSENEIKQLISLCPPLEQKVQQGASKGIGYVDITETPKIFIVETIINKKKTTFKISRETVDALWKVIQSYPLNKAIQTHTVAERYCEALGITRFNRDSGTFQFDKFFGSRQDYFQFYFAIKVLSNYKVIIHHKEGKIERVSNDWVEQQKIKCDNSSPWFLMEKRHP
jgi:hypothetical protein